MRAELIFDGVPEELVIPENTVLVIFRAQANDGNVSVMDADIELFEKMMNCTAVPVETRDYPVRFSIYAFVDNSCALAENINTLYRGMQMLHIGTNEWNFTVTV